MERTIFISHSGKDAAIATKLCNFLEASGLKCWIAPRDVSAGDYAGNITRAIRSAKLMIVVHSANCVESEHIKNEVNIAFNASLPIIPFCIDNEPFGDDLTYYLATKHCIFARGDFGESCNQLLKIVKTFVREPYSPSTVATAKKTRAGLNPMIVFTSVILLATTIYLLFAHKPSAESETVIEPIRQEQQVQGQEKSQDTLHHAKAAPTKIQVLVLLSEEYSFDGKTQNGYPDGTGRYTFKKTRRIDMHDTQERMAEAGDYIVGTWSDGHLVQGKGYSAEGTDKGFILIGSAPNTDKDHIFGKCAN